ncbi:exonuclease SbcCD subunit D [Belnapia rosea]|uniref:exonuclease SbcCD subunit D n=1 Tax=Belnapia rosea TaxID=938405 RepID=UPI0008901584|nr:exonuclease SbcCD subunit D [Belnapia rosea]SDB34686.1 Exodeoxyribonuclease I subunit D [Belnapia rosea]
MRFLHTADWHLGRSLGGYSLQEDQAALLAEQLPAIVRDTAPDAVLLAGDVFDRAVPPAEAVRLLDEVLSGLVLGLGVPVVMIPGNHDEARRVGFGARLLAASRLHIVQSPCGEAIPVAGRAGDGATIVACGYATPLALAREPSLAHASFADHDGAFAALAPCLHALCPAEGPRVLVAHAFVAGGAESPLSERALSVGGSGAIGADRFAGFDYVALGHLHRPQNLLGGRLRYSGSLFPYSVEEADHAKSVTLVELGPQGALRIEEIPLTPRRGLRVLTGRFATLRETEGPAREDYVALVLTDPTPVPEAQRRLAEIFPRIVGLRYAAERTGTGSLGGASAAERVARPLDLFGRFHAELRGTPLPEAARPVLVAAIEAAEIAGH